MNTSYPEVKIILQGHTKKRTQTLDVLSPLDGKVISKFFVKQKDLDEE
jgi:hypothetical protein